jgi:hypothetical protein
MFIEVLWSEAPLVTRWKSDGFWNKNSGGHDLRPSGHSVTAVSPEMLHHADAIVHDDQCFTTQQLALILLISKVTSF